MRPDARVRDSSFKARDNIAKFLTVRPQLGIAPDLDWLAD